MLLALSFSSFVLAGSPHHAKNFGSRLDSKETYLQRLETVDAETLAIEYGKEFVLLLDKREKKYYESLPQAERRGYIALYWQRRDPDPATPENERLEEHLRRRDFAREHFGADKPPYFDERGQIYLKYGAPQRRYTDLGHYKEVNEVPISPLNPNFAIRIEPGQYGRRITGFSALLPGSVMILENETWSYEHI